MKGAEAQAQQVLSEAEAEARAMIEAAESRRAKLLQDEKVLARPKWAEEEACLGCGAEFGLMFYPRR